MSTFRTLFRLLQISPLVAVAGPVTFLLPLIASLRFYHPPITSYMAQRSWTYRMEWRPLKEMPASLKEAVIAAEDATFYEHYGIDFRQMKDSLKKNERKKKYARGFSTITMQLARNLLLIPHKNVIRKGLEIVIALEMEAVLPKDRILELYLNLIEWSDGVYGAEAAARYYFKKSVSALTLEESAFLASIIPSPRKWGRWPPGPYIRHRMSLMRGR